MRLALLASVLLLSAALADAGPAPRVYAGVITDTMCGVNHAAMKISPVPRCVESCVRASTRVKFALYDGTKSYILSDQETPARFAGRRVRVTGVYYPKTNIIAVQRIDPQV